MTTIQCKGMGNVLVEGPRDQYLVAYDPKTGESKWSHDRSQAIGFKSKIDAFEFCLQPHGTEPTRPDGKPNRPLTAFTVMIEEVKDGE